MKYLSLIFCALISIQLSAQNAVEKYFSNHLDNQEATVVQVSGKLFQYAAAIAPDNIEEEEDFPVKDAKEFLQNITSFTLVKVDSLANSQDEYRRGLNSIETIDVSDVKTEIVTSGMSEGQYVVAMDKAGVTLKKSFIIVD